MTPAVKVTAECMRIPPRLRRFLVGVFLTEIEIEDDGVVEDFMFPDWATLRFSHRPAGVANARGGQPVGNCSFSAAGPRTQETYLRTGSVRQWTVLLHPLGWVLLVGESAHHFANRVFDGMTTPAFARFRLLATTLFGPSPDREGELLRLTRFFDALEPLKNPVAAKVAELHAAFYDTDIDTVEQLAERVQVSRRTLERVCPRAFGFAPKTVLRLQRFMRSLAQFVADPSMKWIGAIDAAYHDQAQFVRDFHDFMGMTPSEYRRLAKPVMEPLLRERVRCGSEFAMAVRGGALRQVGRES